MSEIRGPLSRWLDPKFDQAVIDRVQARIRSGDRGKRVWSWAAMGLGAVAVALLALWVIRGPDEMCLANGEPLVRLDADAHPTTFVLSDGTEVQLAVGAHLERIENVRSRLVLQQVAGRVRYEVAPQGERRFVIEAGPVTIEVVGTAFIVDRSIVAGRDRVDVVVEHGAVVVRGEGVPDRVARLEAGQELVIGNEGRSDHDPTSTEVTTVPASPEEAEAAIAPPRSRRVRDVIPSAAPETGPIVPASDDAAILAQADAARREGRARDAQALLRSVADGGRAPHAALAAFSLGRLFDEELGDAEQAERAFERALELGLPSALVGRAWARLASLRGARGDLDGAHEAAARAIELGAGGADRARAERWL